jgi:lactate permease
MHPAVVLPVVALPFAVLFGGILLLRTTILRSAATALAITILIGGTLWGMEGATIAAALVKGMLVTLDILFILLGALLLLTVLDRAGAIRTMHHRIASIAADRRIQAVFIGIFFVSLIEGVAGFGTPAMLAAPLLVAIGFPVGGAILISLVGNVVAVPFGAVGTPLLIGMTQGLSGTDSWAVFALGRVLVLLIGVGLPVTVGTPLLISCLVTAHAGSGWRTGLGIWKQAIAAGLCFTLPYGATALLLGPDFPAILGALIGGALFLAALRLSMLRTANPWSFPTTKEATPSTTSGTAEPEIPFGRAILPLAAAILLLILSRLPFLPVQALLQSIGSVRIDTLGGVPVRHVIRPFYSPGFALLLAAAFAAPLLRLPRTQWAPLSLSVLRRAIRPALTLCTLIGMAQVLLFSSINGSGLPGMPVAAAQGLSLLPVPWPLLAPFVGLFGSLVTGSVTVSNILFSDFQAQTALLSGYAVSLVLAQQTLGAAAGNMVALHNIIAVSATVGWKSGEGAMLRLLARPALIVGGMVAVVGLLTASVIGGGW